MLRGSVNHPYNISSIHWLLWSINERLGGKPGIDLDQPSDRWFDDLISIYEQEEQEESQEKARPNILNVKVS